LEAEIKDLRAALDFEKREKVSGMDMFRRVVKQVFAGLSRKHHPDAGGSVERQMVVNDFYRELIGRMDHGNGIS
jgi:hypothetical protein